MPQDTKEALATVTSSEKKWHSQSGAAIAQSLSVNIQKGLNSDDVLARRSQYGFNELASAKKINPFVVFLRQFKSFIIYILLFALTISIIAGEYIDATTILAVLVLNAGIGFIQEYKAEKSIESLRKLSAPQAQVVRDGSTISIPARELVPGDIILLEEGSSIPADARILESIQLATSEATLTGESTPVSKNIETLSIEAVLADRKNMVFAGTSIARGRGKAIVVETGMNSEIGKIADLLNNVVDEETPLQRKLASLGKGIGLVTIIICIIVFVAGVWKEKLYVALLDGDVGGFILAAKTWLLTSVSLAVAAIPEGLPAIVTIALALGVVKMVKRNALIRKLPATETLGETTVICSDKTGTLTKNEMTVRTAYVNEKEVTFEGEGYALSGAIKSSATLINHDKTVFNIGVLCNNAMLKQNGTNVTILGDPTEAALLVSAEKAGIKHESLREQWKRISELPFSSERKMMSTVNENPQTKKRYVFTKGAVEHVLDKCTFIMVNGKAVRLRDRDKEKILAKNEKYAKQALRVLAFAYKPYNARDEAEDRLIFVGLQGMIDPPHAEVPEAIRRCKEAGIRVIMITGDHKNTAEAIAHEIGIEGNVLEGAAFAALNENEQRNLLQTTSIFARVEPAHKMLMVSLLQSGGEIVAMTGDGVNDAPALKKANLGISMGITGTDVAKDASDMILQDDNFVSIVNAIEEGRGIYDNIKKFVNYLISCNIGEVLVILGAMIFNWPLPMTAIMLLWLNLVTDGLPALALSVDPHSPNVMQRKPKDVHEQIVDKSMIKRIAVVSLLITASVLTVFWWALQEYATLGALGVERAQTLAFTALILLELVRVQVIRSEFKLSILSNKWLILALLSSVLLQLMVIYTPLNTFFGTVPLGWEDWGMIIGVSAIVTILTNLMTFIERRMNSR